MPTQSRHVTRDMPKALALLYMRRHGPGQLIQLRVSFRIHCQAQHLSPVRPMPATPWTRIQNHIRIIGIVVLKHPARASRTRSEFLLNRVCRDRLLIQGKFRVGNMLIGLKQSSQIIRHLIRIKPNPTTLRAHIQLYALVLT